MGEEKEAFFSRWSRRKRQTTVEAPLAAPEAELPQAVETPALAEPPALPPIEDINIDSDLTPYFHAKVDQHLKRLALKKLFQDPHFHFASMDKLDIYIDDYSIADPLPPGMLEQLKFAQDYIFKDPTQPEVIAAAVTEEPQVAHSAAVSHDDALIDQSTESPQQQDKMSQTDRNGEDERMPKDQEDTNRAD